jgi:O-antigen biosynthesis protein
MKDDLRALKTSELTHGRYQGEILFVESGMVVGWAIDLDRPEHDLVVELLIDGQGEKLGYCSLPLGPFLKDSARLKGLLKPRAHSSSNANSNTYTNTATLETLAMHGFAMALSPDEQREAKQLELRVANSGPVLGPPVVLTLPKRFRFTGGLLGEVFSDLNGRLWGWALDPRQMQPLHLELQEEGVSLDSQWANQHVPDLVKHGLGRGFFGFSLQAPDHCFDGGMHRFFVVDEQGRRVPGSPIEMTLAPKSTQYLLSQLASAVEDRPQALQGIQTLATILKQNEQVLHANDAAHRLRYDCLPPDRHLRAQFAQGLEGVPSPPQDHCSKTAGVAVVIVQPSKDNAPHTPPSTQHALTSATECSLKNQQLAPVSVTALPFQSSHDQLKVLLEALADGTRIDTVVVVPSDVALAPWALGLLAKPVQDGAMMSYCDGLVDDEPFFKPPWDPFLQAQTDAVDLVGPLAYSAEQFRLTLQNVLHSQTRFSWQDVFWTVASKAEECARATPERFEQKSIQAIGHVGYTRKNVKPCTPSNEEVTRHDEGARKAFYDQWFDGLLPLLASNAQLSETSERRKRPVVLKAPTETHTKVSVIVPMRDAPEMTERCITSCISQSGIKKEAIELIVVNNQSQDPKSHQLFKRLKTEGARVIDFDAPFNYAQIVNQAVDIACGNVIALLNNDIEANQSQSRHWLARLLQVLDLPRVQAVGCKLVYENAMVQHAGVLFTQDGCPDHMGLGLHLNDSGYLNRNQALSQVPSVTAACMVFRRDDFLRAGAMEAKNFSIAFNDVDLCLRLGRQGRVLVANTIALTHHESKSRGTDRESHQKRLRFARELRAIQHCQTDFRLE